jgi:hypothetical protein
MSEIFDTLATLCLAAHEHLSPVVVASELGWTIAAITLRVRER